MITATLSRFKMETCKPASTPLPKGTYFGIQDTEATRCSTWNYGELIGVLMHLSNTFQPDIKYSVNVLAHSRNSFTTVHLEESKNVLRYLKGTTSVGIEFVGDEKTLKRKLKDSAMLTTLAIY